MLDKQLELNLNDQLDNNQLNVDLNFRVSAEWEQGFTGKLDLNSTTELEFTAPFEISDIWDAEIVSREDDKYLIRLLDAEKTTVTFNANKVDGKIVNPDNFSTNNEPADELLTEASVAEEPIIGEPIANDLVTEEPVADEPVINEPTEPTFNESAGREPNELADEELNESIANQELETDNDDPGLEIVNDGGITNPKAGSGQFRYGEALQKTFLLYEANRSGALPDDNRIEWRSDSTTTDGSDVGLDLTGGYFDAGDHVKFNLPMTANSTMLAWGGIEYQEAYQQAGQFDELLEAVKWGTDYFLKCHISEGGKTKELYVQVGDGDADHAYWGRPEDMTMARPSFKITPDKPGSDVAAGTAAALASASILFRGVDDVYADKLLNNAKQIFDFADTYRGKYSDSVPAANPFYTSASGYADELADGAMWMYKATGEQKYLERAETIFDNEIGYPSDWTWMADNKSNSAVLLLAQESSDPKYKQMFENWAENWINGTGNVKYTEGGLAWRTTWGSLTLSAASSFLTELYHDTVKADSRYHDFANNQIDYILGDNPRNASYVIGFGDNYPQQPHHRGASGSAPYGQPAEHILYGALVGGPESANDFDYYDDRNNWISNEVATGYNAPLTNALIQQYEDFGGDPLTESELDALVGIDVAGI